MRSLKSSKFLRPRTARIDHRGNANAKSEAIGRNAEVSGVGVALTRAGINMNVNVDQPRGDIQAFDIDCLERRVGRNVRRHPRNFAVLDGHVHYAIDVILVIEHVSAAQQQIVDRRGRLSEDADHGGERERDTAVEAPLPRAFPNHDS